MKTKETPKTIAIPSEVITKFETDLVGIEHGIAAITLHIRNGIIHRFVFTKEQSVLLNDLGETDHG